MNGEHHKTAEDADVRARLADIEQENRAMRREIRNLKNAIVQEKLATTTLLNQQKASTFIQRERERYLKLLLANSPSIILFLNDTGRIEFCTDYFVRKAGYQDASDILGHSWTEVLFRFLNDDGKQALKAHSARVLETNRSQSFEIAMRFGEQRAEKRFTGLLVPMKDEQRHSGGLMLMLQDITDLKRSQEEALSASRAKSDFLSNMSHEIRTPMNAIIGMTAIGIQEKEIRRKDYALGKIEAASTHLLGVINDILDISKIESGKMELSPVSFEFEKMLDRVMNVIGIKMHDKQQRFDTDIDPNIPAVLVGDDQRLAQVITNLLSNATKFTPEGGHIRLVANLLERGQGTCVIQMSVRDSGIGMTLEEQSKLFNIFQQAEAGTSRKYGGSGLGLALTKSILELMHGTIGVKSEKGKGSEFVFAVRLDVPDQAELDAFWQGAETSAFGKLEGANFSGDTILLVDDIEINLEILEALLEPTGITIDTATNGRNAIEVFAANPARYDLILMDVQMPEMDGLEATRRIRALDIPKAKTIPIVAMTANVFKEDIEKSLEAGMNFHLGKPIALDEVLSVLAKYLPNGEA